MPCVIDLDYSVGTTQDFVLAIWEPAQREDVIALPGHVVNLRELETGLGGKFFVEGLGLHYVRLLFVLLRRTVRLGQTARTSTCRTTAARPARRRVRPRGRVRHVTRHCHGHDQLALL